MKRLLVVAAGTVALMSGAAYADGGCSYGKHVADAQSQSPVMAEEEAAEALRLERLKAIEEQAALDKLLETPVIHN